MENVGTDLEPDVVRELVLLDEATDEGELGLTRRGETGFDLFESALDEAALATKSLLSVSRLSRRRRQMKEGD